MQFVGRIDREIYRCVTEDIVTDEVIITEERIQHIQDHHPNDYERFCGYLPDMIADPDYIVQDERPYTAMVLKEIIENGEHFRLTLRLVTPADTPGLMNSIITFMKVRKREYERVIRNKVVLYKKE